VGQLTAGRRHSRSCNYSHNHRRSILTATATIVATAAAIANRLAVIHRLRGFYSAVSRSDPVHLLSQTRASLLLRDFSQTCSYGHSHSRSILTATATNIVATATAIASWMTWHPPLARFLQRGVSQRPCTSFVADFFLLHSFSQTCRVPIGRLMPSLMKVGWSTLVGQLTAGGRRHSHSCNYSHIVNHRRSILTATATIVASLT
jgi:hypothetical protein